MTLRRLLHSPTIFALLIAALFARGIVPTGFMPAEHAGAGLQLAICTSGGLAFPAAHSPLPEERASPAAHGDAGIEHPQDDDGDHERPCVYAASAVTAPAPVALARTPPPARPIRRVADVATSAPRPTILRTQSPRAPPARA